ncbi:MAG: MBL fold metallo-hydrolase [Promethearchaeati archaeon]
MGRNVVDSLFYFEEQAMLDCNQYIIKDDTTDELALFDAGNGKSLSGLFDGMEKFQLNYENITKVYLTHEHVDHVLGLYRLLEELKKDPPQIFAYGRTAEILRQGKSSEIFPRSLGISPSMFGADIHPINVTDLNLDTPINIGSEYKFTIYHTPGHSEGSIVYYEPIKKILIPGDLVFIEGSFGRFDFPGGSLEKLQNSIEFVDGLDVTYLLPGHMGISDSGNTQIALSNRMVHSIGNYY